MNKSMGFSKKRVTENETIFNHNLTEKELRRLTGRIMDKEDYINSFSQDTIYHDIYRLYFMRGDKKTAKKYYLMISEKTRKEAEESKKNRVFFGYREPENPEDNEPLIDDETLKKTIRMILDEES